MVDANQSFFRAILDSVGETLRNTFHLPKFVVLMTLAIGLGGTPCDFLVAASSNPVPFLQNGSALNEELDPAHELDLDSELETPSAPISITQKQLRQRIAATAILVGGLTALLGVLFVYLRLEHFTRGFYSARLQTIASFSAVGILVLCYILWRSFAG